MMDIKQRLNDFIEEVESDSEIHDTLKLYLRQLIDEIEYDIHEERKQEHEKYYKELLVYESNNTN